MGAMEKAVAYVSCYRATGCQYCGPCGATNLVATNELSHVVDTLVARDYLRPSDFASDLLKPWTENSVYLVLLVCDCVWLDCVGPVAAAGN